jgi:hypothetical protein
LVGVGVAGAGAVFVVSDDVDGLDGSDEADSDEEPVEGVAVALAPRLSFL